MAHLIRELDSRFIGAYPDAGHMRIEGEEFAYGAAILKGYLRAVAVKDVNLVRDEHHGHGRATARWVQAGRGMVNWTSVFGYLRSMKFQGPRFNPLRVSGRTVGWTSACNQEGSCLLQFDGEATMRNTKTGPDIR